MFTSPDTLKLVVRQYNAAVESVEHPQIRKTFKILDEAKFHVLMVKLAKGWESNLTSTVNTLCAQDPYPPAAPWPDEDFWPSLLLKDAGTFKQRVQVPDSADTKSCTRKQVQTAWVKYFAPQLQRHKLNPPSGKTPRSYAQTKRQGKDASNTGDTSSGTGGSGAKKKPAKKERVFQSLQSDGSKAVITQQTSPAASVPPSLEAKLFSVLQQDAKAEEEAKEKVMGTLAAISSGLASMTSVLQGIQQQQSMQQMLLMRLMQSPSAPGHAPLPQPALWEQFFSAAFQPGSQPSSFPPSAQGAPQITPRRTG
jgi:hypothetical protein